MRVSVYVDRGTALMLPEGDAPCDEMRLYFPEAQPMWSGSMPGDSRLMAAMGRDHYVAMPVSAARCLLRDARAIG